MIELKRTAQERLLGRRVDAILTTHDSGGFAGRRVLITAFVSPCAKRQGEPVTLLSGGKRIGTRRLSRACTVHFRPRIDRGATLRASIAADSTYVAATSRRLRLRIAHPRHRSH